MMTMSRIANYIDAEPFRAFRIKMASGETFEIRHPEMLQAGKTTCTIFTWMSEANEELKEREREISIILIESIEPLKPANTQDQSQN
jgi:hypothetical protein